MIVFITSKIIKKIWPQAAEEDLSRWWLIGVITLGVLFILYILYIGLFADGGI